MANKIIIIGGGPGGYVAALRAAGLGGEVILIEKEHLGGTCLNWGCIPSKIMKHTADLYFHLTRAHQFGIRLEGSVCPDMPQLMARKTKVIETQRKGIESLLQKAGVGIETGRAVLGSGNRVDVIAGNGSRESFSFDRLIIAAGTVPMTVTDFPFDHTHILSSNDLLELKAVPESIVIVGGGVIGCEFAGILSDLGSKVTIVEAMSRLLPLPSVDNEISKLLLREMKKKKISVLCDTVVTSSAVNDGRVEVHLDVSSFTDNPAPKKPRQTIISAEKMAVCIGRSSVSAELGLDAAGIETTPQGWIRVDAHMQTSVKGIFAIGDILGPEKVMLAHVASHEGMIAAENAMDGKSTMKYEGVPSAIFTMPEIGTVGLSETQALEKGYDIDAVSMNFRALGKAQAIDELAGIAKMIVEKKSGKVLGVHLAGAHATDLIAEAALAIRNGLTAEDIAHTIHAHPTLAEIMGETALKALGMPIHG